MITPLDRKTRTPVHHRSPITLEVMDRGAIGEFYLLYVPYPVGKDFKQNEIKKDLEFLVKVLELMFLTYGFSAKKTSGFGVIEPRFPEDGQFEMAGVPENILPKQERKFRDFKGLKAIVDKVCKYPEVEDGKEPRR